MVWTCILLVWLSQCCCAGLLVAAASIRHIAIQNNWGAGGPVSSQLQCPHAYRTACRIRWQKLLGKVYQSTTTTLLIYLAIPHIPHCTDYTSSNAASLSVSLMSCLPVNICGVLQCTCADAFIHVHVHKAQPCRFPALYMNICWKMQCRMIVLNENVVQSVWQQFWAVLSFLSDDSIGEHWWIDEWLGRAWCIWRGST